MSSASGSPARPSRPPQGRRVRRAHRARVHRRRRVAALVVAAVVVVALTLVLWALAKGDGSDSGGGAKTGTPAGSGSSKTAVLTPSPSPTTWTGPPSSSLKLKPRKTMSGASISPKSVVSSGTGYVFAQNMMYKHTVTVYDSETLKLVETIQDAIDPDKFHIRGHGDAPIRGAPVECAFLPDGRFAYVSRYSMYGPGFVEGQDAGSPGQASDSYVYRVSVSWIGGVGSGPRHLCMAGNGTYLYARLNGEGNVAKIDPRRRRRVVDKVSTGSEPRSMAIAPDGESLFVVNYNSSTMSQVRTTDMKVVHSVGTNALPIGITDDAATRSVWLCCYTGSIMVFRQV